MIAYGWYLDPFGSYAAPYVNPGSSPGRNTDAESVTDNRKQEKTMTSPSEILRRYRLLPNEYKNLSFEMAFRNESVYGSERANDTNRKSNEPLW